MRTRTYNKIFALVQVLTLVVNRAQSFYPHTVKNHVVVSEELLIRRVKVPDWMSCILACQNEPECFSYNYQYIKRINGLCELLECGEVDQMRGLNNELFYSHGYLFQQLKQDEKMKRCSTGCWIGWTLFRSHCFKAINRNQTWEEASQYCKDKGGYLPSIHSQEEHDFLVQSMGTSLSMSGFWIGLRSTAETKEPCRSPPSFSDGTAISYQAFQPYRHCTCEHLQKCKCVKVSGKNWFYRDCDERVPFICKLL